MDTRDNSGKIFFDKIRGDEVSNESLKEIYLVRETTLHDGYNNNCIDQAYAFNTRVRAMRHIRAILTEYEGEEALNEIIELIELTLNVDKPLDKRKTWAYSTSGKILYDPDDAVGKCDKKTFARTYKAGDLVYMKPKLREPCSPSSTGEYCVIADVPLSLHEWIRAGGDPSDWEPMYEVHYINYDGFLDSLHVYEKGLSLPPDKLPEELKFLRLYANHVKGIRLIPEDVIRQILEEDVYVLNTEIVGFVDDKTGVCIRNNFT